MLFQNFLVFLMAAAGIAALPAELASQGVETIGTEEVDTMYGNVMVNFYKSNNRGCNNTPSFKTVRIFGNGNCQRINAAQAIGSSAVTINSLRKDCTMSVYNTKDCTAGNYYVVPTGVTNCWAQDVQSVKITCPKATLNSSPTYNAPASNVVPAYNNAPSGGLPSLPNLPTFQGGVGK